MPCPPTDAGMPQHPSVPSVAAFLPALLRRGPFSSRRGRWRGCVRWQPCLRPEGARMLPGASSPWKTNPSPPFFFRPEGGRDSPALRAEKWGGGRESAPQALQRLATPVRPPGEIPKCHARQRTRACHSIHRCHLWPHFCPHCSAAAHFRRAAAGGVAASVGSHVFARRAHECCQGLRAPGRRIPLLLFSSARRAAEIRPPSGRKNGEGGVSPLRRRCNAWLRPYALRAKSQNAMPANGRGHATASIGAICGRISARIAPPRPIFVAPRPVAWLRPLAAMSSPGGRTNVARGFEPLEDESLSSFFLPPGGRPRFARPPGGKMGRGA